VCGDDAPIPVLSREKAPETRGAFTEITKVMGKDAAGKEVDNTTKDALGRAHHAVMQTVASTRTPSDTYPSVR
jgi:phosphate transport system substrate-binding protein